MTPWLLAFVFARGLDLGTTVGVLNTGGSEANPSLPQRPALNLTLGAAITIGQIAGVQRLAQSHPRAAKWILVAGIAVEGWAVAHNWRALVEGR
jgi:hypothetical protein